MPTLYLTDQGSTLSKTSERLLVEKAGQKLLELPAFKVDRVLIFGNVQISTQAIAFLLANGIDTSFFTIHGKLKGKLMPIESKNIPLRMNQYERAKDEDFKLNFAQSIVTAKIKNQKNIILRYARNHPEVALHTEVTQIETLLDAIIRKTRLSTIMGIEGQATATYFYAYSKMLRQPLRFQKRTRRPPHDPVNSLLSLGYTLIGNEMLSLISAMGFDPYIGFYHGIKYGRPALALDLIEEFRTPIVDRFVLYLINNSILKPVDFISTDQGGVILKDEPRKRFFTEYERYITQPINYRKIFKRQLERLALAIKSAGIYVPFRMT